MTKYSAIGFIQIEIQNKEHFVVNKISKGIETMFQIDSNIVVGKNFEQLKELDSSFSSFLLKEIQHTYESLISHSESFSFETSFLDSVQKKKYLCHLTLLPQDANSRQLFDITVINVSIQSKNIFILEEVLQRTSSVVGEEFFDSISLLFHDFFGITAAYVGFFVENNTKNYLHSFAKNGVLSKGISVDLHGSTCDLVLQQGEVTIETDIDSYVQNPPNPLSFKREAFLGQPITNQFGKCIGLIGIQHETKIQDIPLLRSILRILAPRTFSEYSRLTAEKSLIDKNLYYQFLIENISSNIISTNEKGIIQNVTNSVYELTNYKSNELIGSFLGSVFSIGKDYLTQKLFFNILSSNINTPIVTKVSTKNEKLQELSIETKKFQIETGEIQFVFIITEHQSQDFQIPEYQQFEYFLREAKIIEFRNILLKIQQSLTKDSKVNIDYCLRTISLMLQCDFSSFWELQDSGLYCHQYFDLEKGQFHSDFEGLLLDNNYYEEYINYLKSLTEPSIIYDVLSNPITAIFEEYFLKLGIKNIIEIPIWVNGVMTGMLCIEGKNSERRFEEYEIAFLSAVSVIIAQNLSQLITSKTENALLAIQEQLHSVFHKTTIPLVIIDIESMVVKDVNATWLRTFNYQQTEVLNFSLREIGFFDFCNSDAIDVLLQNFRLNTELTNSPLLWKGPNKETLQFRLTTTHFSVENSTLAVLIFHNVSDIKTESTNVNFTSELLNEISEDSIETTSISNPVSMKVFAQELLTHFSNIAAEKDLSFSIFVDEKFPSSIFVDSKKIEQLTSNLVSNSIQNTQSGFISLSFVCQTLKENEITLILEVKDSGKGMSEEEVTHIFDKFDSKETSSTFNDFPNQHRSGLTKVKEIVTTFSGSITIESTVGLGTTISIELPSILIDFEHATFDDVTVTTFESTTIQIDGLLFLVLKNTNVSTKTYEKVLNDNGATIYATTNLEETLQACEFIGFHCMVLFIDKPKEEDIPLLSFIQHQQLNSNTPIIVVTNSIHTLSKSLQSIAVEVLEFSTQMDSFLEALEILFPNANVEETIDLSSKN